MAGGNAFEVAVGAILTQNTNWKNVEKAIFALKEADSLTPEAIADLPNEQLEQFIRPAGFFRMKAKKLKHLVQFLDDEAGMDIESLRDREIHALRPLLLGINGVGPETADSILNYALDMPIMVVDAYTHRMMHRHGLIAEDCDYDQLQSLFMYNFAASAPFFNEFHALIVRIGKDWCKKTNPKCESCPLSFDLQ